MAETFSLALTNDLNEVAEALPSDFNTKRFVQNAVALLNENTQLQDFAKKHGTHQIKLGIMKGAYLGLDFMNSEAHLIPYGDKLNFIVDYRGDVKLSKKYSSRPIKDIYAKIVREGDEFEEKIEAGQPSIFFKPKPFNNAPIIGAFAVCLFEDGGMIYDTMSLDELENTRRSSKMANGPAWKNFTGQMYIKTVLHRLCKHIDIDFDNAKQKKYFWESMEIATVEEQVANDIEENANSVDFDENVLEGTFTDED